MADDKLEIIRTQFMTGQIQSGSILANVLEGLPPEEVQKLRQKAAEGMLASELERMKMQNRFQASAVDIDNFIRMIQKLEEEQKGKVMSGYDTTTKVETASGQTTIRVKRGCFVATAVYGSADHPNVIILRRFRDQHLETNPLGRAFCAVYYRLSPRLADGFFSQGKGRKLMRSALDRFCKSLS